MPATTRQVYRRAPRAYFSLLVFAFVVAGPGSAGTTSAATQYDREDALQFSQGAIGGSLSPVTLRDTAGQPFDLRRLRGKPVVISMIYTSCHHVCPMITRNLAETISVARDALGEDEFAVVTVGFDWRNDTPQRMRQFATDQGIRDGAGWYFLAADERAIADLSDSLGFVFFPSAKGFDHLAQATIVDSDGVVYRQVYGVDVETTAVVEPLKQLVFEAPQNAGVVEHWVTTLRLFCTVYDPNSDRYRFDYSIFTAIVVGVLSLGLVATFIAREWRNAR